MNIRVRNSSDLRRVLSFAAKDINTKVLARASRVIAESVREKSENKLDTSISYGRNESLITVNGDQNVAMAVLKSVVDELSDECLAEAVSKEV